MPIDTGKGRSVILSQKPLQITSVTGKKKEGSSFFTTIRDYVLENDIVKLTEYYASIKVEYDVEGDPEQFSQFVGKETADAFFQTQAAISKQTSEIYDDVQFDKINNEGVTLGNFNEEGGLKSLQAFTKVGKSLRSHGVFTIKSHKVMLHQEKS